MAGMIDPIALRHTLHRIPELGFDEQQTKARLAELLEGLGLEVSVGVGVVAVLRAGTGNRAIGLRAELDALPIHERSEHAYASQRPGVMHACGHDGHMAMLVAAAQMLAAERDFDGTVVFLFQPAEEHGKGALAMLEAGFLDRFPVDELYAMHNLPGLPVGHVQTRSGLVCSSESLFEIDVIGQGGHAAMPHTGRDALTIAATLIGELQTIVARRLAPGAGAVLSVTECLTDGQRNVLPGHVTLRGDVRARSAEDRTAIARLMRQICDGLAMAHGVSIAMSFETEFIETQNDANAVAALVEAAQAQGIPVEANGPVMSFSEDFAHFAARVPSCFALIGNGEASAPLHAATFDFNDAALDTGARLWAELVRRRLAPS
jgi:hippurate hydrolase